MDLWIPEEVEILEKLIEQEASQVEMASALPGRNWRAIRIKAYEIIGSRNFQISPRPIRDPETYDDYLERVRTQGKEARNIYGNRWTEDEIELLEDSLDNGATQLEMAAALPHRSWEAILKRIAQIHGKGIKGFLAPSDTIQDYLEAHPETAGTMSFSISENWSPLITRIHESHRSGSFSRSYPKEALSLSNLYIWGMHSTLSSVSSYSD